MEAFPELDIYFPKDKEALLIEEMKKRAGGLWKWQPHDPFDGPAEDGRYYLHREKEGDTLSCTFCLYRKLPGHIYVTNITPDTYGEIAHDEIVRMMQTFHDQIAEPAVNMVDGYCSMGTGTHTLEDYFSKEAIGLLDHFCKSSNAGDLGTHTLDQQKWIAFLLDHYRNKTEDVHCDIFGELLRAKKWWPEYGIPRLVREYDFAMRLLKQADERRHI